MGKVVEIIGNISEYLDRWQYLTVCIRLVMAMAAGGLIGMTRSVKRRGAGFKTHALVCLGAALVMLTGEYIYHVFGNQFEISRMGAQVVSGMGFLGVGTIIVTGKNHIQGLTTAAGLWTCAGIGLAFGIGFYTGAITTTLLVLFIYIYMERMDDLAYSRSRVLNLYIEFDNHHHVTGFILGLKKKNYKVVQFELSKPKKNQDDTVNAMLTIEVPSGTDHEALLRSLSAVEGVIAVEDVY